MSKIKVTSQWIGGEPRVTISRNGTDLVNVKLLGSIKKTGSKRLDIGNYSDTVAKKSISLPAGDIELILKQALSMARSAGANCWVWDSADIGVAKLHAKTTKKPKLNPTPFNDDIGF